MATQTRKKTTAKKAGVTVSKKIRSYANDPFVVKKAKESKTFLEKHGFPEKLLVKK